MADLGRAVYILTADATRFQRGLTQAEMAANTMVGRIGRGFSRLGMRMQSFGRDMSLYVTGPILYAAKHSLDALGDFEDEIRKSIGLAEVGKKQYGMVTKEILAMSRELGKGPQELAEGLYFISSAGFKANAAMKILEKSAMGAAAGLGEVNEVGDAVTSVINAYGRANINAKQSVDVLTTSVRYGKGEADALAKTIGVVVGVAQQAGVEFTEVGAAIASMTRLGMPAARSVTSLRSILGRFADPTEEVAAGLKKIGTNAKEVREMMEFENKSFAFIREAGQMSEATAKAFGLDPKAVQSLKDGAGGLFNTLMALQVRLQQEGVQTASIFDSTRAQPGFESITGQSASKNLQIFEATTDALKGQGKEANSTRKAFEQMEKSVGMDMRKMHAAIDVAEILFGKTIAPMARESAENIADLAEGFSDLTKPMRENIAKWVGIAAAAGPVSFILGSLLRQVRFLLTPFGLFAALAVGAAVALGKIHVEGSETITLLDKFYEVGKKVLIDLFEKAKDVWNEYKDDLAAFGRDVFPKVLEFFRKTGDFIEDAMPIVGEFVSTLLDLGRRVIPPLLDVFGALLDVLQGIFSLFGGGGGIGRIAAYAVAWLGVLKVIKLLNVQMRALPGHLIAARGSMSLSNALGIPASPGGAMGRSALAASLAMGGAATRLPQGYLAQASYVNRLSNIQPNVGGTYSIPGHQGFQTAAQRANIISNAESQLAAMRTTMSRSQMAMSGFGARMSRFGASVKNVFGPGGPILNWTNLAIVGVMHVMAEWQRWGEAQRKLVEIQKISLEDFRDGTQTFEGMNEQIAEASKVAGGGIEGHGKWSASGLWEAFTHMPSLIKQGYTGEAALPSSLAEKERAALIAERNQAAGALSREWFDLMGMGGSRGPRGDGEAEIFNRINSLLVGIQNKTFTGALGLEDADSIARLMANYRGLGGTFENVSSSAIRMYVSSGKVAEAQKLIEKATKPVLKAFREQTKELLDSESTYKKWGSVVEAAVGLSARQRRSFLLLADAAEQHGIKLSDQERQVIKAAIETDNYGRAMKTLSEVLGMTFGGASSKIGAVRDLLKDIPDKFRKQVIVDVKLARKGKHGEQTDLQSTIDDIMFGLDASKFDPSKAASVNVLSKIIADTGIELGKKARKELFGALKGGSFDEALGVLGKKIEKVPDALRELNRYRTEHMDDAFMIEFETNIDDVVHEVELGFHDIWNMAPPKFDVDTKPAKDSIGSVVDFATGSTFKVGMEVTDKKGGSGGGDWNNVPWGNYHTGGRVRGKGDIPAVLEGGEFVVNKNAAAMFGSTLERINKYHNGGWVNPGAETKDAMKRTVATVINEAARYAGEYAREAVRSGGGNGGGFYGNIVKIGRELQNKGFLVGEHPKFGGVEPVHTANSWHYKGLALDINWPGANESQKLRSLFHQLKGTKGLEELFHDGLGIPHPIGNHDGHLHFAMNGPGGGSGGSQRHGRDVGPFGFRRDGEMNFKTTVKGLQRLIRASRGQHGTDMPKGTPASAQEAIAWGKKLAASRYGWTGPEWKSLYQLWANESGWEPGRLNPSSFAAGIPQALPGTKIYGAAFNSMPRVNRNGKLYLKDPDAKKEISWGLDYIRQRADYGKPSLAWKLWNERDPHWYGDGAVFRKPRVVGVGDGRYDEAVVPLTSQVGQRALERMGGRDGGSSEEIDHLTEVLERFVDRVDTGDTVLKLDENEVARIRQKKEILRSRS